MAHTASQRLVTEAALATRLAGIAAGAPDPAQIDTVTSANLVNPTSATRLEIDSLLAPLVGARQPRATVSFTSAVLADGATEQGSIVMGKAWRLYSVATDRAARVRLYDTVAHRVADVNRAVGAAPGAGLMFEYVSTGAVLATTSPVVDGVNMEAPATTSAPLSVTNGSGAASAVTVTLIFAATE